MKPDCCEDLTYEERQKLIWRNVQKRWDFMDDDEKVSIINRIGRTPCGWIPKALLYDAFTWFLFEITHERIEVHSICEQKRNEFKLIDKEK